MALEVTFNISALSSALTDARYRVAKEDQTEVDKGLVDVPANGEVHIPMAGKPVVLGEWVNCQVDDFDGANYLTSKGALGWAQVISDGALELSGTQLFLLDSLTAGPGSIIPHPYYIEKQAFDAGRLRKMWVRPTLASTQSTKTGIQTTLGTVSNIDSVNAPNKLSLFVDGTQTNEEVTLSTNEFPWRKITIYFEQKSGGGSFDVTAPVTQTVDLTGIDGAIGKVEITNPNTIGLEPLKLSNFTTSVNISGFLFDVSDVASDYIDVISWAVSGRATTDYNECVNIVDWYSELGVTGAVINTGTNDTANGYSATLTAYRELMDSLALAGVTGQDVLTVRPNDNAKNLGDLWEDIRDEYSTRFTSIVRIYGDLAAFNANNWMADGDNVHPNDTFNEIWGGELYALNAVTLHDAIDLGSEPNWISTLSTTTSMILDSTVTLMGDFEVNVRFLWGNRNNYLWDNSGNAFVDYLYVQADGTVSLRINENDYNSVAGTVTSTDDWYTLNVKRVGTQLTVNLIDADGSTEIISNAAATTDNVVFSRFAQWAGGYSIAGSMAWVEVVGQHLWLFNQNDATTVITDQIGAINGSWSNRVTTSDRLIKYSIMGDGTLLDYHYNLPTTQRWGSVNWPTGA